jgi:hypothetical protein
LKSILKGKVLGERGHEEEGYYGWGTWEHALKKKKKTTELFRAAVKDIIPSVTIAIGEFLILHSYFWCNFVKNILNETGRINLLKNINLIW